MCIWMRAGWRAIRAWDSYSTVRRTVTVLHNYRYEGRPTGLNHVILALMSKYGHVTSRAIHHMISRASQSGPAVRRIRHDARVEIAC